jgi:hypothetical protein
LHCLFQRLGLFAGKFFFVGVDNPLSHKFSPVVFPFACLYLSCGYFTR